MQLQLITSATVFKEFSFSKHVTLLLGVSLQMVRQSVRHAISCNIFNLVLTLKDNASAKLYYKSMEVLVLIFVVMDFWLEELGIIVMMEILLEEMDVLKNVKWKQVILVEMEVGQLLLIVFTQEYLSHLLRKV